MNHLTFSLAPQREVTFSFAQSSPSYYTDDAGNLYQRSGLEDSFDIEIDGKAAWQDHLYYSYAQWQNGSWESVYSYSGTITYVDSVEVENTVVADIRGQEGTKADIDAHFEQIGMRQIHTRPAAYTRNVYDAVYKDSLLEGMNAYFTEHYDRYLGQGYRDIDNDGQEEAVFLLPGFADTWFSTLRPADEYSSIEDAQNWFVNEFREPNYTGIVIADEVNGELVVSAYCVSADLPYYDGMDIRIENRYLWLDNYRVYLSGSFESVSSTDLPAELAQYMADHGYTDHFFRIVDVSDIEGEEYMCVCRKDGVWYVFVFVIVNGDPVIIYSQGLGDSAVYLTEYEGKQCLLVYYQSVYTFGGESTTYYSFDVLRVTENGTKSLDYAYANYSDADQDASAVSAFFDKLNVYMIRIIVVCDLYELTGSKWMAPEDVLYGAPPVEENQQPGQDPDEMVMGFVDIEDPASWLHLRVGPGTEYDRVLMDPNDPNSFVRQALGSPVTVLETIHTGDGENPTWVKIRITYQGTEIIGYSSKTYIRMAE